VTVFGFIAAKRAEHSVKTMCRVLEVSRSGFHAWARREPSLRAREDARLTERIREIHRENRKVYGSPRIHAELPMTDGTRVARRRVERLMRPAGISGLVRRRRGRTTISVPGVRVCEGLVDRLRELLRDIEEGAHPRRSWPSKALARAVRDDHPPPD